MQRDDLVHARQRSRFGLDGARVGASPAPSFIDEVVTLSAIFCPLLLAGYLLVSLSVPPLQAALWGTASASAGILGGKIAGPIGMFFAPSAVTYAALTTQGRT